MEAMPVSMLKITVLLSSPVYFTCIRKSKNISLWSLERSTDLAEIHDRLTMLSGVVVRTRSKMSFFLVGNMLTCSRKKSNVSSLNLEDPAKVFLSGVIATSLEFQVGSGKLKSRATGTLS